ncbi:MAG: hypothetical protein QG599_1092 [Pseudomonadota bacterium]|nr:hypothetical protein [Pseudomonadota bacterium]
MSSSADAHPAATVRDLPDATRRDVLDATIRDDAPLPHTLMHLPWSLAKLAESGELRLAKDFVVRVRVEK